MPHSKPDAQRPVPKRPPWNKGKLIGQKPPLKPRRVWTIRARPRLRGKPRDLAMFNLAIDSKPRGRDLVALRAGDVAPGGAARNRAVVRQKKTGRPVQFEITGQTRQAVDAWIRASGKRPEDYPFTGQGRPDKRLSVRQYARLVAGWIQSIGLDPSAFGTHSPRRTKAALIHRKTGNPRAVQLLLRMAAYCPRTAG